MQQLAKQGYTQSYTYFTWRVSKHELTEYLTELTQSEQREYMRPNFWPNTLILTHTTYKVPMRADSCNVMPLPQLLVPILAYTGRFLNK
jgi:hypothetical protein